MPYPSFWQGRRISQSSQSNNFPLPHWQAQLSDDHNVDGITNKESSDPPRRDANPRAHQPQPHNNHHPSSTTSNNIISRLSSLNPTTWTERFRVVLLCFASFVICNCDRINISVAILPMAKYYGWSQTTVGIIQSSFFWGYVLTQIPGGYLADRYGGKQVLAAGVIVWSAMTLLTPMAASTNLGVLLLSRALLGVGEGVAMPAMNNIISKWVPPQERSRSLSLTYSGMYLGSVVGLWLCPTFIVAFGWPSVFYIFGGIGFFWWVLWQTLAASEPNASTTISEKELDFLMNTIPGSEKKNNGLNGIPWKKLLTNKATWAIIVAHFCVTWGMFHKHNYRRNMTF